MKLTRLPLDSSAPVVWFAAIRLIIVFTALVSLAILSFPYEARLFGVLAIVALPWALAVLAAARTRPAVALHPLVAVGDFAVLVAIEGIVPETYGVVRFFALFLVAAHAHFQGERIGLGVAAAGVLALLVTGALTETPVVGDLKQLYEALFAVCALATAIVVGGLRTAESAGRLRARDVTRRTFVAESALRKQIATSIHDGPVQELVSLELILGAARQASERGDRERAAELIRESEGLCSRNVQALREEIVGLGPHAFQDVSFEAAIEERIPMWRRRYGIDVAFSCDRLELDWEVEGALYRIAQEAVANAGRHAEATNVRVSLQGRDGAVELMVADDGKGFHEADPLALYTPGHLGLASMRERAEAVGGRLGIATDATGTVVLATVPLEPEARAAQEPETTPAPGARFQPEA